MDHHDEVSGLPEGLADVSSGWTEFITSSTGFMTVFFASF